MTRYTLDELCRLVDHTNLHADAREADILRLCDEARRYHFAMVAVNPVQSALCASALAGTDVRVGAAIGFPLGQVSVAAKVFETKDALASGASEIDYVVNLTQVKEGRWDYVADEMRQMVTTCHEAGVLCKVIFENCYLGLEEKLALCQIAREVGPDFVKTSTGYGSGGATVEDVRLMVANVGERVKVKAAGGIRDADSFLALVAAGARRIGCSAGIPIMEELHRRLDASGAACLEL